MMAVLALVDEFAGVFNLLRVSLRSRPNFPPRRCAAFTPARIRSLINRLYRLMGARLTITFRSLPHVLTKHFRFEARGAKALFRMILRD